MLALMLGCMTALVWWMMWHNREKVSCLDLITSPAKDGKEHGRLSRTAIGQVLGIIVAAWAPVYTTMHGTLDVTVLGVCLSYLGLVEGYSKWLRYKYGKPGDAAGGVKP